MDVLLIIDMQKASFSSTVRYDAQNLVFRINQLSDYVRGRHGKVIFIQHDGTLENGHLPFTEGGEILSSLSRCDVDYVVRKSICDAFYQTELREILSRLRVERLIISGCATDFCVDTTIRSVVSHGYHVVVVSDCHTTADRPHLKAEQIIEHHNWVWRDLLVPNKQVEVLALSFCIKSVPIVT